MGRYEVLHERANGLEMPEFYTDNFDDAAAWAIDLAHEKADGGYTGRACIRNGYDEAVYSVQVRGPLTLMWNDAYDDLPFAMWNGNDFDYYEARYSQYTNREFLYPILEE